MAKKLSKKESKRRFVQQARIRQETGPLLAESMRRLRRGNMDQALTLAMDALSMAEQDDERHRAQQVVAEVLFRMAMLGTEEGRLARLRGALEASPDDARIRFHLAVTLLRAGQANEALREMDAVAAKEPERPGLAYLRQLARLAQGKATSETGLSADEVTTLRAARHLMQKQNRAPLVLEGAPLGQSAEAWQALELMRRDPAAAPIEALEQAANALEDGAIQRHLLYYKGVAAMRAGEATAARQAWLDGQARGLATPWLTEALAYSLRERAVQLAAAEAWAEIVELGAQAPDQIEDRILAETIGLAYFHLGYEAAQAGKWLRAAQEWRRAEPYIRNRHLAQNLALAEEALNNWKQAAEAWRAMARRRPRSTDHPDYLTDSQVAGIWRRAAYCYRQVGDPAEAITCMRTAIKYDPQDTEFRRELVSDLLDNDQLDAARNELERTLAIAPDDVATLIQLASLNLELGLWRGGESIPLWRRALAVEPQNQEASEGLARAYVQKIEWAPMHGDEGVDALIEQALTELPNHPRLLLGVARSFQKRQVPARARELYLRAYEIAPEEVPSVSILLHELLHLDGDKLVEEMLPRVREIPLLLPGFWFNQSERVLHCKLDPTWVICFSDEAIKLAGRPHVPETAATLLMSAYEILGPTAPSELKDYYSKRIRNEAAACGGPEFVAALEAVAKDETSAARRLFNQAKRAARRSKDKSALAFIEEIEEAAFALPGSKINFGVLERLMDLFPDGPPSPEILARLLDEDFL